MPIGFLSEHSVEFVLVPRLISILSKTYSNIVPFYFWAAREGNSISQSCDTGEYLRLIAVYPRRPKVSHPHDSEILIKFNAVLFEKAREYEQFGIPVFAGVPRVSSIMDFRLNTPCTWFEILGAESPADIEREFDVSELRTQAATAPGHGCSSSVSSPATCRRRARPAG